MRELLRKRPQPRLALPQFEHEEQGCTQGEPQGLAQGVPQP